MRGSPHQRSQSRQQLVACIAQPQRIVNLIEDDDGRSIGRLRSRLSNQSNELPQIIVTNLERVGRFEQIRDDLASQAGLARMPVQADRITEFAQARHETRSQERALACARRSMQA